jgi:hypothetical protein
MVLIEKNKINEVVFTFSELMFDVDNFILLELISEFEKKRFYLILSDNLSLARGRFDKYLITEGVNLPLEQKIILKPGSYIYNAYEQTSNTNLDTSSESIIGIVETGRILVKK